MSAPAPARLVTDVHQHLWPEPFVDLLRSRSEAPYLRGWHLQTQGEPPFRVNAADHDPQARVRLDHDAGVGRACLAVSSPLGIETLPVDEATPLLDAWHDGLRTLPVHFRGWASVHRAEPDLAALEGLLGLDRVVGLQLSATDLATPAAWERSAPLLALAQRADRPVLIHPGPVPTAGEELPGWWAPVVSYTAQMAAAWWAWHAWRGRDQLPTLRLLFGAGAGLAPLHHERFVERGGETTPVDPDVFVDTSGYGPRALDALIRVLGIDTLVLGSDRPYGAPVTELFGEAASHAVRVTNPQRLLGESQREWTGEPTWAFAS